ncbi:hypothetical protein CH29_gp37 [Achromobacter phage JWAlpha]|uniref:Uncharacterized protein n=1 Tax=Achromobacter phage JWAlpha TaxID=1416009 RepID=V9VF70_9CAUD|nr:hypothetical protein CH29_gp37 [Achromobacter phage JWAlpha]AHC93990.1 hypothetical protein JJJB_0037 [Achromobacter phage JWAlpha]
MNTVDEIKKAIQDYFGDTERSRQATRDGLEDIASEVDCLIDALRSDTE